MSMYTTKQLANAMYPLVITRKAFFDWLEEGPTVMTHYRHTPIHPDNPMAHPRTVAKRNTTGVVMSNGSSIRNEDIDKASLLKLDPNTVTTGYAVYRRHREDTTA